MENFTDILGLHTEKLNICQMIARAIIIFITALILIRIAGIRTLGKQTAFDTITLLIFGSVMGRAIVNSDQSFPGSILAALTLMLMHRLAAWLTYKSKKAGSIIKGEALLLIKNGTEQKINLSKSHITEEDVMEALRSEAHIASPDKIKEVYLERSGTISIVKE